MKKKRKNDINRKTSFVGVSYQQKRLIRRAKYHDKERTIFILDGGPSKPHYLDRDTHRVVLINESRYIVTAWEKRLYFFHDKNINTIGSIGFKLRPALLIIEHKAKDLYSE